MSDLTPETKEALSQLASAMLDIGQQMAVLTGALGSLNAAFERLLRETGVEELDIDDALLEDPQTGGVYVGQCGQRRILKGDCSNVHRHTDHKV